MTIERLNPTPRWSDATVYNGTGYFVEIANDTDQNIESQISQIFAQAENTLAAINSDKSRLLSVTIYLTDLAFLATFNAAWEAWLPEGCAPSRACVKAELVDPSILVELTFVAAVTTA